MIFRKCPSCGALVTVLKECNCPCGIECCDEKMEELVANSVEAAAEKPHCGKTPRSAPRSGPPLSAFRIAACIFIPALCSRYSMTR